MEKYDPFPARTSTEYYSFRLFFSLPPLSRMCLILFLRSKKKTPPLIISSPVSPNLARVRKSASKKRIPLFSSSPPILPFPCLVSRGCTTRECSARVGTLSTRAKEEEDRTSPEDPPLSSSSPAPPSPLSPPSLPRCVSTALALPSHPSLRPTPFPSLPLIRTRQTCLFLRLAMGCRDPTRGRERERERRRLQPASNGAKVACTPSPPKIPIPLVSPPHEERRGFFLSRRNAAENRRSPPRSATPRWQTLRPRPDSLSNILVEEPV